MNDKERAAIHGLVDAVKDEAIPLLFKAVAGLVNGKKVEEVLTQAERDVIASGMLISFDEALKQGKG